MTGFDRTIRTRGFWLVVVFITGFLLIAVFWFASSVLPKKDSVVEAVNTPFPTALASRTLVSTRTRTPFPTAMPTNIPEPTRTPLPTAVPSPTARPTRGPVDCSQKCNDFIDYKKWCVNEITPNGGYVCLTGNRWDTQFGIVPGPQ